MNILSSFWSMIKYIPPDFLVEWFLGGSQHVDLLFTRGSKCTALCRWESVPGVAKKIVNLVGGLEGWRIGWLDGWKVERLVCLFLRFFRGFDIEPVFDSHHFLEKKDVIRYRKGPSQPPKVWILMVALEVWKLSVPKKHWFPRRSYSFWGRVSSFYSSNRGRPICRTTLIWAKSFPQWVSLPQKKLATPAKTCVIDT